MSDLFIGLAGTGLLFVLILCGAPIMLALFSIGFGGILLMSGWIPSISLLGTIIYPVVSAFHFSAIPMFLLMGFFAIRAGIGDDLFEACSKWFGRLPGGLALASTGATAAFGAASGSSVGTATLFTKLAMPEMVQRGYDRGFAAASIAIAGTLAVLIPPSALIVVYGILTNAAIGKLLIAGIIPGAIFAVLLAATVLTISLISPEKAPANDSVYTLKEKLWSLRMIGPLVLVITIMLGGLYGGVFTPTESGAVGAFSTFIMALIRCNIREIKLGQCLTETVVLTAMIFAIIIGGLIFARFLALSGVSSFIQDILVNGTLSVWMVVTIVTLVYLLIGMLMDAPSLLAISLPITHPVMMSLGFDPIWFGVYVIILAEIGAVTPPIGLNCFVVKGAAGNLVKLEEIFKGLVPFIFTAFIMLALLLAFPNIALWLPGKM
ncbi:TRAP transporter large permease [Halomonas sp. MCCC 1A11036]|uniref:TRAP transporter large permease protein n=1 Tax=Billgrantia zhangzhouensis TaxID=2733481 RepID=A0ABS9AII9_9GAMM|nr:TRAP transporter large permease [Halomonas zhangzhouensis]MCE8021460.1 TRAP transporter large permease [Halomonas zhangzhouensis]